MSYALFGNPPQEIVDHCANMTARIAHPFVGNFPFRWGFFLEGGPPGRRRLWHRQHPIAWQAAQRCLRHCRQRQDLLPRPFLNKVVPRFIEYRLDCAPEQAQETVTWLLVVVLFAVARHAAKQMKLFFSARCRHIKKPAVFGRFFDLQFVADKPVERIFIARSPQTSDQQSLGAVRAKALRPHQKFRFATPSARMQLRHDDGVKLKPFSGMDGHYLNERSGMNVRLGKKKPQPLLEYAEILDQAAAAKFVEKFEE